jgi:hypothetical protein
MERWDSDDARSSTPSQPTQSREDPAQRVGAEVRQLSDHSPIRAHDRDRGEREHRLTLPSGPRREAIREGDRIYRLRGSEVDLLERAARFRSVFTEDLKRDSADERRFGEDLRSLERQGLVEERTITRLRDSRVADVIAVTAKGKALLDHHRDPQLDHGQAYYGGWVKPAEIWHDASLFRMSREAECEIKRAGGRVRRVILDDELKARAYRALHAKRERPDGVETVAAAQGLHVEGCRFVLPDVRLEIEEPDGSVRAVDLELVTEHYHRGHIGGKARAGFRMFRAGSSAGRGGTPRDEHLMKRVLR